MSKEDASYFPPLPERYPRPADLVPHAPPPVPADLREEEAVLSQLRPGDAGSTTAPPSVDTAPPERPAQERVQLTGRLGQDPTLRTTPKGTLVAKFPLGVKDHPDGKTTWHRVLAFQARAEQVRDTLTRGDAVDVIGYRHAREIPGRTGPRTIHEIYATVLKKR